MYFQRNSKIMTMEIWLFGLSENITYFYNLFFFSKVGSAISMTYITGQPIVFVGSGQTYTDLKALNAKAVVQLLMKW